MKCLITVFLSFLFLTVQSQDINLLLKEADNF